MKFDREVLGSRIRLLRQKSNQSLNDVASALSTKKSSIGNIEHGRTGISIEMLIGIADHFNVSIDYLLGRTDNPEINK